jgi:hypothetical protein
MAVDTRDKRASVIGVSLPSGRLLPLRDGSVDPEDFEQLAYTYRGIAAGEPVAVSGGGLFILMRRRRKRRVA